MEMKYYFCKHCGKIIVVLNEPGTPTVCCGEIMTRLLPGTTDASIEKHVPILTTNGNLVTVNVGENPHPMTEDHYIEWILLVTNKGLHKKFLQPGEHPTATFIITENEKVLKAYEFCNLHKLWKSKDFA